MTAPLFDDGPYRVPDPLGDVQGGTTARRTARNRLILARGYHPATLLPLSPDGYACEDCAHAVAHGRWWKCRRHVHGMSHCEASDIRISWPACTAIELKVRASG